MQMRGEWPPAGWLAEEARGSEQAPLAKLPGGFLGWAAGVAGCSARGKARLDRDGPGPCASYKGSIKPTSR